MKAEDEKLKAYSDGECSEPIPAPPGVSENRVEELQVQIQSGGYPVSAPELAAKIVAAHMKG